MTPRGPPRRGLAGANRRLLELAGIARDAPAPIHQPATHRDLAKRRHVGDIGTAGDTGPEDGESSRGCFQHRRPAIVLAGTQTRMAKPTIQERRKQALRQRRAEEQREFDREDAGYLYRDAVDAHRSGDIPAADRFLKKALVLDPHHARALGLLFEIHRAAGHYAEALGYLQRRRKVDSDPKVLYNIAGLYQELGQEERSEERRVGKECRSRWSPDP